MIFIHLKVGSGAWAVFVKSATERYVGRGQPERRKILHHEGRKGLKFVLGVDWRRTLASLHVKVLLVMVYLLGVRAVYLNMLSQKIIQ
jgi:hypothetical protein